MTSKSELRQQMGQILEWSPSRIAQKSALICAGLALDPAWGGARTVAMFAPHRGEPDIDLLWARAAGKRLLYPRVRDKELDFYPVADLSDLEVSRWGLREPGAGSGAVADIETIDLVLVPGVAFTRRGMRLGRGGGFYDRFLSRPGLRAVKIGVCFGAQLVAELPNEPHDMRVDRVVEESSVLG